MNLESTCYCEGEIGLCSPDPEEISRTPMADDVAGSARPWLDLYLAGERHVIYFSIYRAETLIGQIFLHDGDPTTGESLIGYQLFQKHNRGHGIGTKALRLLIQFVAAETSFTRLSIITDYGNQASRRIAEKCDFTFTGVAREGWPLIVYERQLGD